MEESRKIVPLEKMIEMASRKPFFSKAEEWRSTKTLTFDYDIMKSQEPFMQPGARNIRGIVYNVETGEIIALPFFKFFEYQENNFANPQIMHSWEIENVYPKIDGTLIYFALDHKGNACPRTRGGWNNRHTEYAYSILSRNPEIEKLARVFLEKKETPMFEMVTLSDRHVVDYDFNELVFLGSRSMETGKISSPTTKMLESLNRNHGIDVSKIAATLPLDVMDIVCDELKKTASEYPLATLVTMLRHAECYRERDDVAEGFVVHFKNGEMVKLKYPQYIKLHKIANDLRNETKIAELIIRGSTDRIQEMVDESKRDQATEVFLESMIKSVKDVAREKDRELDKARMFSFANFSMNKGYFVNAAQKKFGEEIWKYRYAVAIFDDIRQNSGHKVKVTKFMESLRRTFIREKWWRKSEHYRPFRWDEYDM